MYEYLYKCIRNDITQGKIKAGEKLPSKRSFAKNLGISVITVENAYGQLLAEGYIYSMPKRGFYVSDLSSAHMEKKAVRKEQLSLTGGETSYFADFSSNQTDSEIFPFAIWSKTVREVLNDNQKQLMINPPCGGILELRQAIAQYLREFRAMQVDPEQIVIGAGTEYLHGLLIQLLVNDRIYGVENPGYHKISRIYENMKVEYAKVSMDQEGVSIQELEEKRVDIIHTSPSHHFPTGIVMPVSRRYELLGWAAKSPERYIIEDDYDSELRLSGKPFPTLQSIDASDKVIYMNTFTKTLASTVRISYMVLPLTLTEKFYQKLSFYSCTVSNFEQYTLAKFMENGSFEKHINRLRNYYQMKWDAILKAFRKEPLGRFVNIQEEGAGVHFLMQISTAKSEEEIVKEAKGKGIKLAPLSHYFDGEEKESFENTYVVNYSSVDLQNIERAAQVLGQILVK
ncbi:MAG: PLP-dependent aminotransferase family protein [Lachnospiraceae bacterium]